MVSFTNAFKLLMLLPLAGKLAQVNRGKFTWILHKNYAGSAELERKAQIDRTCHFADDMAPSNIKDARGSVHPISALSIEPWI